MFISSSGKAFIRCSSDVLDDMWACNLRSIQIWISIPLDTDVNWTCVRRSEDVLHIIYVLCLGPCFSCFEQVLSSGGKDFMKLKKVRTLWHKLTVHKMFRRLPQRLLSGLCTFKIRPVFCGKLNLAFWACAKLVATMMSHLSW